MAGEIHRPYGDRVFAAPKRTRLREADDDIGSHWPPPKPAKRLRHLDAEEEPEEESAFKLETSSQWAPSPVKSNTAKTQYAEEHNVPPRVVIPISTYDSDLHHLFDFCRKCCEGGEAADWHLDVSGLPCKRQELHDAFRTGNASGVAKSLHRFMSESLRHGHGEHRGLNASHSSIWMEDHRRRLLRCIGILADMGTYDCLSLAYRLLWKLKDLPQEPHLDEMRRARSEAGGMDATRIDFLPQDDKIDIIMFRVITRRVITGDKWAWEHDLAALDKQASLLTEPTSTQWFISSRRALGDLGKQREGLTSELLEPLPGFQCALDAIKRE